MALTALLIGGIGPPGAFGPSGPASAKDSGAVTGGLSDPTCEVAEINRMEPPALEEK